MNYYIKGTLVGLLSTAILSGVIAVWELGGAGNPNSVGLDALEAVAVRAAFHVAIGYAFGFFWATFLRIED